MRQIKLFLFFVGIASLVGCNYTKYKIPLDDQTSFNLPESEKAQLSYGLVYQKILVPKCVSCHGSSGNVNLESYEGVLKDLVKIKKSVFEERTMPKRGNLSTEELAILWNWIALGAPQDPNNGPSSPPPVPLEPTYDSISKNIFEPKCVTCHSAGNSGRRVLLTKDELLNSPLELVLPGDPDESGLVIAVERKDDKRMPLAKEGYAELKEEEKLVIRKWIENGAKD